MVDRGLKVEASVIRDKFGLPDPEPGAELLSPQAAAQAFTPAGPPGQPGPPALNRALPPADAIDQLGEQALSDWQPVVDPILDPIRKAVAEATSFEDLKARLPELVGKMDSSALVQLLATEMFKARGLGDGGK
jgi:phage gp29-like protein